METKEIKVGDYIRGFKYDCGEYMFYRMNDLIGKIAKVIKVDDNNIHVKFSDGKSWCYPKDQAIEHLVGDDTTYTLSDLKADYTNEYKKDNINPEHYKSKSKETKEPKLYSILLSKDNESRVYCNLNSMQVQVKVNKYSDYHSIIVEQGQNKGIQVLIKE
jgi:hypothetical protein